MIIVVPRFKIVQKLIDKINGITRENLTGIRVVRAFNAEKYQENKFDKVNNNLTNLQLFNQKKFAIMMPVMYLIMYGLTLSIYFIGAGLIQNSILADKITIFGNMIVFSSYAMQVIMSFLMLAMIFMILPRASVSAKRINEVLDTKQKIIPGTFDGETKEKGTKYIEGINPESTIQEVLNNIETNGIVTVYKEDAEITDENTKAATSMIIKIKWGTVDEETYTLVVKGDLNGDGEMGDSDLLKLVRYQAGLDTNISGAYLKAADIYKDGSCADNKDLLKIVRVLAGLEVL